jgi:hypothetical protein
MIPVPRGEDLPALAGLTFGTFNLWPKIKHITLAYYKVEYVKPNW